MNIEDQIHENTILKKKISKLEEKVILLELEIKKKETIIKDQGLSYD